MFYYVITAVAVIEVTLLLSGSPLEVPKDQDQMLQETSHGRYDVVLMNSSLPLISNIKQCMERVHTEYLDTTQLKDWMTYASRGCSKSHCQFINGTDRLPVPLLSYPGSGNTWVRGLLEKATGICTGAVHHDMPLIKSGFIGHGITSGAVIVTKTHHFPKNLTMEHMVFILRDPFDTLVADYQRRVTGFNHTGIIPETYFVSNATWNTDIGKHSRWWRNLATTTISRCLNNGIKVHVIRYEALKENKVREVEKVLQFLTFNYDKEDLSKRLEDDFDIFKRSQPNEDFNHYTESQKKVVNNRVSDLAEFADKMNFTQLYFLKEYLRQ